MLNRVGHWSCALDEEPVAPVITGNRRQECKWVAGEHSRGR